jgi:hypothetical protein
MKKLLAALAAAAVWASCVGADPAQTERGIVASEIRKAVKDVSRIEFVAEDRAVLYSADGRVIGRARYSSPFAEAARGFRGPVPVLVIFTNRGTVRTVRPLPNQEDARFWQKLLAAALFESWSGFPVREAAQLEVDAVTSATYSSRGAIDSARKLIEEEAFSNGK